MRVFISWSGELSKQLAGAIRDWLPATLQYVKPYFTPADIEKGAKWDQEISNELEACAFDGNPKILNRVLVDLSGFSNGINALHQACLSN